ncbi:isocitrate/isopropylmalate dehydrogenase family protein [Methanosphaerula palustris]|uniref:3-isopropylmalate dehydrogenase n=1 Tax=Methanosphaerula palustris (strain ATCC BAA-1556 / DSM 19958 / E1-9c) TaxID=521011 RepID=B8GDU3_METPE|nr:isocitrate/isopropylmalate dehydrogenase family protein [Methanosphaerula palustris]ACL17444.1 3-isopropylmalate dehydrogenase [Methanosphaerula palustris E1-9c]
MTTIAVVEGDGIGREVVPAAVTVLSTINPDWEWVPVEVGYARWQRTGSSLTSSDLAVMKEVDAVLFGAITTPPGGEYPSVILQIRKALDLYANIRPVRAPGVDLVTVRENTEGLYSGIEWEEEDRACSVRVVSKKGTRRIAARAATLARERNGHLTIGHKANVLRSDQLFLSLCTAVADEYQIPHTTRLIDALCLDVLLHPEAYDVIVTTNLFGDILSDVTGYLAGGLGMLPSANLGDRHALFEPVHGSAPDIAGTGRANPIAAIESGAMMLNHLGYPEQADLIEAAIQAVMLAGIKTPDIGGSADTRTVTRAICRALQSP